MQRPCCGLKPNAVAFCGVLILLNAPLAHSQISSSSWPGNAAREDQLFIQPKADASALRLSQFHVSKGCKLLRTFDRFGGLQLIQAASNQSIASLTAAYRSSGLVEYAEPDYIGHVAATTPNDPAFANGTLWALNNFGQNGGTPHADIDAVDAWDILTSASNIVVAVLDTGIRYTHEDLAANMWTNPVDASHGTNAVAGTTDANDDSTHGTPVAGVLGAVGNNGKGVTGVAWRVQLMSCKCFKADGTGSVSDTIACFDYAIAHGARIINASFGFAASQALSNVVSAARDAGIIVVAAAGNSGANIDVNPPYPAGIQLDNVISVAYTTRNDTLAGPSNYGSTNVHLAAPGDQIYSTFPATDNFYYAQSGSSFAAPYVAGACALLVARYPADTPLQTVRRILIGTDPLPSLAGKCLTGGRLNLRKALSPPITLSALSATNHTFTFRISTGPNRPCTIQSTTNLSNWNSIATNVTSAIGTLDFTDTNFAAQTLYRVLSAP